MIGQINTKPFNVDHVAYAKSMAKARFRQVAWAMGAFFVTVAAVLFFFVPVYALIAILAGAITIPLLPGDLSRKYAHYLARPGNIRTFTRQRVATFTEDFVFTRTEDGIESRVPWSEIYRASISDGFLLLWLNEMYTWIIPLSAFGYQRDLHALKDHLVERRLLNEKDAAAMVAKTAVKVPDAFERPRK